MYIFICGRRHESHFQTGKFHLRGLAKFIELKFFGSGQFGILVYKFIPFTFPTTGEMQKIWGEPQLESRWLIK